MNAVGAGGGSIAWIDRDGLLKVGPQSAGAHPGPACYGLGGADSTVTDANVILGRLNGKSLLAGRMPIDKNLSRSSIELLAAELNVEPDEAALGIVSVACATMVKAIRSISVERGHDPSDFALFVYGGAGALHAVDVARDLGMTQVIVPPSPGILCAEGAMNAALSTEYVTTILAALDQAGIAKLRAAAQGLSDQVDDWFVQEEILTEQRKVWWSVGTRYFGQNFELSLQIDLAQDDDALIDTIRSSFHQSHAANYGFASESEPIQVVNIAVKAIGDLDRPDLPILQKAASPDPVDFRDTLFSLGTRSRTPVFERTDLVDGQVIKGPAIVEQMDATVLIFPGDTCNVDRWGNLVIELAEQN